MISQTQDKSGNSKGQTITLAQAQHEAPGMTPLQRQTAELVKVLAMNETGTNYKNAFLTSLLIIKALVAWLYQVVLTGLAALVWACGLGYQGGYLFRKWIVVERPSTSDLVCTVLRGVTSPFVFLYGWATGLVNRRLGWDVEFDCLEMEYDFTLEPLLDMGCLPTEGTRLVYVAKVDEDYHVRIFDGDGRMIFGELASKLLPNESLAPEDEALVQELNTKLIRQAIGETLGSKTRRELIQKVKDCLVRNYSTSKTPTQNLIFKNRRQQPEAQPSTTSS